jgi:creatinine amidohydrolase
VKAAPAQILELAPGLVREQLETGAPVYLFVNPNEYHGPHLPPTTDALVSEGIVGELHARLCERHPEWPLLHGGALAAGVEPVPGPGTESFSFERVRAMVLESCRSLADLGAKRVVLATFHGNPLHNLALEAGVQYLRRRGLRALAPMHLLLAEILALEPSAFPDAFAHIADPRARAEVTRELASDFHAGFFETSMALHYAPTQVSPAHRALPACPSPRKARLFAGAAGLARALGAQRLAAELENVAVGVGWYDLSPFPGYTGRPALAAASAGKVFADAIVSLYAEAVEAVLVNGAPPPSPVMRWIQPLTLGGRVGMPRRR